MTVDDLRDEVWVPCLRTSQALRIQFRTARQLQALKDQTLKSAGQLARRQPEREGEDR